jgi:hypothetical protein
MNLRLLAPWLLTVIFVAACGTPDEVREYAKTSGAQMTSMQADLKGLSTREQGSLAIRRRSAALLMLTAQQDEADLERDMQVIRQIPKESGEACGRNCSIAQLNAVLARYQQQERVKADRARESQTFLDSLDSKTKPLATSASIGALENASKLAGSLGDEMTKEELAAFLFDYFKQVKAAVDEGQKQADKAAAAAGAAAAKP